MSAIPNKPDVICLLGPTASGKTAVAVELVQRLPLEIISVDSAQIYRGLDIGSGKPDAATLRRAPHRLIDIVDPSTRYSASDFRHDATAAIEAVLASGKTPLLVGGTMLYFKVLRDGLAALPRADAEVRREIEALATAEGWAAVHAELQAVDPESAARIHPNDPQRLSRALEVYRVSGRTMTAIHGEEKRAPSPVLPWQLHFLGIEPADRKELHERIAARFRQMLAAGFEQEVRALHQRTDLDSTLPAIKSVGYRQMWAYLNGELHYDEMVEKSIIATRQLAKRQLTWMRGWPDLHAFEAAATDFAAESLTGDSENPEFSPSSSQNTGESAGAVLGKIANRIANRIERILN